MMNVVSRDSRSAASLSPRLGSKPAVTPPAPATGDVTDRVELGTSTLEPAVCVLRLGSTPDRVPKFSAGLTTALKEFGTFSEREYYNEAKDALDRKAYYADIDWSAGGKAVFDQLSDKLGATHTHKLDYSPSTHLYPWVDLRPNGELRSIYSGQPMDPARAIVEDWDVGQIERQARNALVFANPLSPEAAAAAFASQEVGALNCEHVVPQSWFSKAQPERGDLHHLFACDPSCNSSRGNLPYDEYQRTEEKVIPDCGTVGPGPSFEPSNGKGAVARATLYFLMRYPKKIGRYDKKDVDLLLDWNRRYPPDLYEKHRNAAIFEIQGNRNPLIDFPDLAGSIDFAQGLKGA